MCMYQESSISGTLKKSISILGPKCPKLAILFPILYKCIANVSPIPFFVLVDSIITILYCYAPIYADRRLLSNATFLDAYEIETLYDVLSRSSYARTHARRFPNSISAIPPSRRRSKILVQFSPQSGES